jgi:hypothetical protein
MQRLATALFLSTTAILAACGGEEVRVTPTPTAPATSPAATSAAPSPTPTRTATSAPTTAAPSPTTPRPSATASPGGTPASACPTQSGGSSANRALLTAVRVAHHDTYDRVVFEFSQSTDPGTYGLPPYTIATATSLAGPSGQPVTIDGNALMRVRVENTDAHDQQGQTTVSDTDVKASELSPQTTIVREVRLVEDFEGVNVWGVGLSRLACPSVLTLTGPVRLVLDFPTQ